MGHNLLIVALSTNNKSVYQPSMRITGVILFPLAFFLLSDNFMGITLP